MEGTIMTPSEMQKTTADQIHAILSSQSVITYSLINIMIKMNVVNVNVFQVSIIPHLRRIQFESNIVSSRKL